MKLFEIIKTLDAKLIIGDNQLDTDFNSVCASDLMSDVLAFVKDQSMLLTGLNNPQVARTAEMMDMRAIVFVRGKTPDDDVIKIAKEMDIALIKTDLTMYTAAGKLYAAGLVC